MITDTDVKKLEKTFVSKKYLKKALEENNQLLVRDIIDLFDTTNERIDKLLDKAETNEDELQDHENRIRKVEDKILVL